jgi:hypothetical protein
MPATAMTATIGSRRDEGGPPGGGVAGFACVLAVDFRPMGLSFYREAAIVLRVDDNGCPIERPRLESHRQRPFFVVEALERRLQTQASEATSERVVLAWSTRARVARRGIPGCRFARERPVGMTRASETWLNARRRVHLRDEVTRRLPAVFQQRITRRNRRSCAIRQARRRQFPPRTRGYRSTRGASTRDAP